MSTANHYHKQECTKNQIQEMLDGFSPFSTPSTGQENTQVTLKFYEDAMMSIYFKDGTPSNPKYCWAQIINVSYCLQYNKLFSSEKKHKLHVVTNGACDIIFCSFNYLFIIC